MKKVELLSPAKDLETGIAAINFGADAVYIGASNFGARKSASNSLEDIEKLVKYAHKFYVRIHVAINTILKDEELIQAIELIHKLYKIGVDAIIIQDMGIVKAAIEGKLPPIQIHTSTQCNTRTLEKAHFFDKLGVSRIVLARELSLEKIKNICENTSCEIETFIHGALCVSYSGQCYLSFANGGRSANRGECAQPCRKKYSLVDENGKILLKDKYLLSLKDFNASEKISDLINCGVNSFKIEGRLKDINYVKNITAFYNQLINKYATHTSSGKVFIDFEPNPYKTFNRDYTQYFLEKRELCFNFLSPKSRGEKLGKIKAVNKNYFEIDEKINPQDGICFIREGKLCGFLVNKVDGNKVFPNKMDNLKKGLILYRNFNSYFDKVLTNSKTTRKIGLKVNISDNIYITDEDNNSIIMELPEGEIAKNQKNNLENFKRQFYKAGDSDFYIEEYTNNNTNLPFYPISKINEIRRNLFDMMMKKRLENYPKLVQNGMNYSKYPQDSQDFRANIYNGEAETFYQKCSCKITQYALEHSKKIPKGIELMRTKHCLKFASGLCQQPIKKLYLVDEKNKKYPLKFDCKNCEMVILSP